jgi:hypothetical protein
MQGSNFVLISSKLRVEIIQDWLAGIHHVFVLAGRWSRSSRLEATGPALTSISSESDSALTLVQQRVSKADSTPVWLLRTAGRCVRSTEFQDVSCESQEGLFKQSGGSRHLCL